MKKNKINRRKTSFFSALANELNDNQESLKAFINRPFSRENFEFQLQEKKNNYSERNRSVLCSVLDSQLQAYAQQHEKVAQNLKLLKNENTFTVTAGHQLNLMGGPLYTIYKIIDAIRLAEELSALYPSYNIIPVFWMATEDHDFEEINHINLFHSKIVWESEQKGPVGRFNLEGIEGFKNQIKEKFQNNPEFIKFIDSYYKNGTLANATTQFFMDLVGKYGLIIIDADSPKLKQLFQPILLRELTEQFSEPLIREATQILEEKGYHGQAMARPINLFYIKEGVRERIIPKDNNTVEIGGKSILKNELIKELEAHPERFSPNVVMRPLYQECILPNLCYLGGGGEMSYWLQLKAMFEESKIPFPLIKIRNSIQWIDTISLKKLKQLELNYFALFEDIHQLKKRFIVENADEELDFSMLDKEFQQLSQEIISTVIAVDKGLKEYAKSEATKIEKQIDHLKKRLIRQAKKKNDDEMKKIETLFSRSFPGNVLQERVDNMLPYLAKIGKDKYISTLYDTIDPFSPELIVLLEEEVDYHKNTFVEVR